MAPATILQLIPSLDAGGAEKSVVEMTDAVIAAGGHLVVVAEGGRLCSEVEALGGEIIKLPVATKNPLKIIANAFHLKRLINGRGIALVHARSRAPAWSGLIAARLAGVRFVTTYHGAYNQKSTLKGFYNGVMARGDRVIANSKFTASLIRKRHHINDDRLHVIYRGVDLHGLDPAHIDEARVQNLLKSFGIDEGKRVVLQAARLTEWKGQRDVIEAAKHLKQVGVEDVVFVLAGDAQGRHAYKAELDEMIKRYKLEECVKIVGHVNDMAAAYSLADIVVVASREAEAFGRTAAEAQAMGCPVIATDIGAPPEFLNLGDGQALQTAWLAPVQDGKKIAELIEKILAMPGARLDEMAGAARDYIANNFTAERMKTQTIAVYEELLGGPIATVGRETVKKTA